MFRHQNAFPFDFDNRQGQSGMISLKGGINARELPLVF